MLDSIDCAAIARQWLSQFSDAAAHADEAALRALLVEDSHWRNILGLGWTFTTTSGAQAIAHAVCDVWPTVRAQALTLDEQRVPPALVDRAGETVIESAVRFDTSTGSGTGIVRLMKTDSGAWGGWSLMTAIHEPNKPAHNSSGTDEASRFGGKSWAEQRERERAGATTEPDVLVVGGGHAGLCAATELGQRGIRTLVIDRYERVGDNWRKRYHALSLHNRTPSNHLPYLPFPSTFPRFIPKDQIADWLEAYANIMELNLLTKTSLSDATYCDIEKRWTVTLEHPDTGRTVIHPQHIVMATSVSGTAKRAEIPGIDSFSGSVFHSSEFQQSDPWRDRPALVFGTGTSAHDIAQDLEANGANVTMVQRSPTLIVNLEPSAQLYDQIYYGDGPPLAERDLLNSSMPLGLVKRAHGLLTRRVREIDAPLHKRLRDVGFQLEFGEDDTGWPLKYRRRGGGYYFNAGCSELIADRRIGLVQYADIERLDSAGAVLRDGSTLPAELVVLATGYHNQDHLLRQLFGDDVADRVGPVWGFDDATQELRNMWTATPQTGLWFTAGAFSQCRIYSRYLALQIEAMLS